MATPPEITLARIYYGCRLGRRELDSLFTVASQGFQSSSIRLSHQRHNRTFTATTLTDLIAAVQAAPLPGNPDVWTNLTFTAADSGGRCGVTMRITDQEVDVTTTGTEPTWVYGLDVQIRIFLMNTAVGGRLSPKPESNRYADIFLLFASLFTLFVVRGTFGPYSLLWVGFLAGTAVVMVLRLTRDGVKSRASRARLVPVRDLPTGSMWQRLAPIEQITAVGVVVAAVAAVGTLASAASDLF